MNHNTKIRLGVLAPEPRSGIMAYFHLCQSKYKILLIHVLNKNALHVSTW